MLVSASTRYVGNFRHVSVSIGRRLLDSVAEFVKIDPKHVGIGQYQVCGKL